MKNKGITYLLICMAAALWGLIFYRVFAQGGGDEDVLPKTLTVKPSYFKLVDHASDSVLLDLDYEDPFSTALVAPMIAEDNDAVLAGSERQPLVPPMKPIVNWPKVLYAGAVYNPINRKVIAILNIDGKEVMMAQGERVAGIRFLRQLGDSISIEYRGQNKYLHLK